VTVKAAERTKIAATAEKYVKAGKLVAAIVEYEKLLDGTVQDIPISNIIGDLHLRHGDDDKAVRIFSANIQTLMRRGALAQALAIAKKVQKTRPHDFENIIRLGDLYGGLGFVAEAKAEYFRAAEELDRRRERGPLLALYEKLARLDRTDLAVRLKLARLYLKKSQREKAVVELNDVADLLFVRNEFVEAEKILRETLAIQDDHVRTILNLARVLVSSGKSGEAVAQVERNVSRHGDRPEVLGLLAGLRLEAGQNDQAAEIYGRILAEDPNQAEARARLGWIEIRRGRLDEAYEIYEPLVHGLLRKNKEDKAVGLLGLILMSGTMHLPTLEKVAAIFRAGGRRPELEVVDRVLLAEYRELGRDDDRARIVRELIELAPFDPGLEREFKALHWEARVFESDKSGPDKGKARTPASPAAAVLPEDERDIIRLNLGKADEYLAQGLVRNARRVVDNLLLMYPDHPAVVAKLGEVAEAKPASGPDVIDILIGQMAAAEAAAPSERAPSEPEDGPSVEKKMTASDLFSGLDIVPLVPPAAAEEGESDYLDLEDAIAEELEAIEAAYYKQVKDRTVLIEQDLTDIVQEFRRQVESKMAQANLETRYSLGQAFLEQGLYDEAVEEFKIVSADLEREADCHGLIAQAYARKRNFAEAEIWLGRALEKVAPGSTAHFALTYDLAALFEAMNRNDRALALYREVREWNPKFRDVARRSRILEKIVSAG